LTGPRLRLAGEPQGAALPIRAEAERIDLGPRSIAVAGAQADAMAALLSEGGASRWRAQLRQAPGEVVEASGPETIVRASADAIERAIERLAASYDRGEPLVAVGEAFVAIARPRLAILVTGGAPAVSWAGDLRALRDRFDLVVEEPRPSLARELARALRAP
jgi:hypothetical protein